MFLTFAIWNLRSNQDWSSRDFPSLHFPLHAIDLNESWMSLKSVAVELYGRQETQKRKIDWVSRVLDDLESVPEVPKIGRGYWKGISAYYNCRLQQML